MLTPVIAGSMGITMAMEDKKKGMKILQIYSGGMDSTALLYDFINKGHKVETIWFNYGQKHKKEQLYAKEICNTLKVKLSEVNLE